MSQNHKQTPEMHAETEGKPHIEQGQLKSAHIENFMGLMPEIDQTAYLASSAALIGAVRVGADSSIWHQVTLRGDANYILVGAGTNIQDNSCVHIDSAQYPTLIGSRVTIGHSAVIHACTLHDSSFVGMGAIIMDGAVVESHAMVAAGALVTPGKRVPSGSLWAGSPAKEMRRLSDAEIDMIETSADRYIEMGRAAKLGVEGGPYKLFTPRALPPHQ